MKQGIILALTLIVLAGSFWFLYPSNDNGNFVEITKDGEKLGTYSLHNDKVVWVITEDKEKTFILEDNEIIDYYDFSENIDLSNVNEIDFSKIENKSGKDVEINMAIIKDDKASIYEANCPTKVCVNQGSIYKKGQMITCAPHKLVIKDVGESDLDG